MEKIKSIDKLLGILDTRCNECEKIGWDGVYNNVERKGDSAIFHCSFSISHLYEAKVKFETPKKKIEELVKEIQRFIENRPSEDIVEWKRKQYIREGENLAKKLQIYADFASKNLKIEFDGGYCPLCFAKVPVRIEDRKVYYSCSYCATMLADI